MSRGTPLPVALAHPSRFRPLFALLLLLAAAPLLRAEDLPPSGDATPNEILSQAQTLIQRSDYTLAQQLLDRLIAKPNLDRPTLAQAVFLRGRLAQQTDQLTNAVVWYNRYINEYPDQVDAPYATFLLGQTYKQLGTYDRAREAFYKTLSFAIKKASTLAIDDFSSSMRLSTAAAWELAETEYLASNWERADELYERFKKQNPTMEKLVNTACYRQADISFQLQHTKEAIARYESALALAPFHPFATEAWLRLVSLYGITGDKEKQSAALQSFIWVVNTLEKDDQLYWQRRCADQLLAQYRDHLNDQIPLLETILKNQNNESWMRMLDFYLSLLSRQNGQPNADIPQPSSLANDSYNDWLRGFRDRLGKIVQKLEVMRNTDTPAKDAAAPQ